MKSDYSIFDNLEVKGKVKYTISRGTVVIDNGQLSRSIPKGRFVPRSLKTD